MANRKPDRTGRKPPWPDQEGSTRSGRTAGGDRGIRGAPRPAAARVERHDEPRRAASGAPQVGRPDAGHRQSASTRPERGPVPPAEADPAELDGAARAQLQALPKAVADDVARHLVAAGQLLDVDPAEALRHALAARAKAGRIASVREAAGVAAYHAGEWQTAITELRTFRRLSGSDAYLPVIADCERALGRPDRALEVVAQARQLRLDAATRAELLIVASGARRDIDQPSAAVATLQVPELHRPEVTPWVARLRYAYADALLAVDRVAEAREWFMRAAQADPEGETDAEERVLEIDGIVLEDLDEDGSHLFAGAAPVGDACASAAEENR